MAQHRTRSGDGRRLNAHHHTLRQRRRRHRHRRGEPAELTALQNWFQNAILDPHGHQGPDTEATAAVLTGSARQTAGERLAVYQRGYRLRLLGSLRACFPALRHLLGPGAFDALAGEYVEAVPPSSYTLDHALQGFPAHLA